MSLASSPGDRIDSDSLASVINRLAHLLPAQGPISIFIHHNTLHAYEELPFEDAVVRAAGQLACEPVLPESRYRAKLAAGRILSRGVQASLEPQTVRRAGPDVGGAGA